MAQLIVTKDSFTYLVNQRGEFAHLAADTAAWYEAYYAEVQKTIGQIGFTPYHVLDIGSGLGAVDALMAKHYGSVCTLIDSEDGAGNCKRHDEPFCSFEAVERFMRDNEVPPDRWRYCDPSKLHALEPHVYDLVISFRSWCFHYPPSVYMEYVKAHACAGCRLIIDVRKDRRDWREQLQVAFEEIYSLEEGEKYDRVAFVVRGLAQ